MSRLLRLELSGGLYLVTSGGDRHEDIFADDIDREAWLEISLLTRKPHAKSAHAKPANR